MADVKITITGKNDASAAVKGVREDLDKLKDSVKNTSGETEKGTKSLGSFSDVLGKIAAAGLLVKIGQQALEFGKASIQAAGDAAEMQSKFDVVFGESAPAAQAALEDLSGQVNRSATDLQTMAASVQDTFVPLGFARDAAANLSVELTKLAVDVGSFNNVADADVMRDFQSALVGNTETVRKYGIVITEANTKQKAYEMGLADVGEKLTEQQKVQARLQLIMEGTTDAQGDAIRTADSYANTQKGLQAATKDLQIALGNLATKGLAGVNQEATGLIKNLTDLVGWYGKIDAILKQHTADVLKTSQSYEEYTTEVIRANIEAGKMNEKWGQIVIATLNSDKATQDLTQTMRDEIDALGLVTKEQYYAVSAAMRLNDEGGKLADGFQKQASAAEKAEIAEANLRKEQESVKLAMADLQNWMQGPLSEEYDNFVQKNADLQAQIAEVQQTIQDLGGTEYMTPAQAQQITTLQSELNNVATQIVALDEQIKSGELNNNKKYVAEQNLEDLRQTAWELEQQIKEMGGKPYVTSKNLEDIDEAKAKLAELNQAIAANAAEHRQATKEILFDIAVQEAARDGITTEAEKDMLLELAKTWDLISEAEYKATLAFRETNQEFNDGLIDSTEAVNQMTNYEADLAAQTSLTNAAFGENGVGALNDYKTKMLELVEPMTTNAELITTTADAAGILNDKLNAVSGTYDIRFNITQNGSIPNLPTAGGGHQGQGGTNATGFAGGADFVVPPGYPNDSFGPLYVQSGEHVQVTPAGESASSMGGMTVVQVFLDGQQIAARVNTLQGQQARLNKQAGYAYTGR